MIRFTITGVVREAETGIGIPNLFVKAYDKDLIFDDLLGTAITAADGSFEIITEAGDFREFFDVRPDLYLRVLRADRVTEIWSSEERVRWNAGQYEEFDVRIPRAALMDHVSPPSIIFVVDDADARAAHLPGESLVLRATGLHPSKLHSVKRPSISLALPEVLEQARLYATHRSVQATYIALVLSGPRATWNARSRTIKPNT